MIIYTNAPKDYDYWYVTELLPDVGRMTTGIDQEKPVRKLDMPVNMAGGQCMRYQSGLYPALTEEEFGEWIGCGFINVMTRGGVMEKSDLKSGRVIDEAKLGIVEQVWFAAAVDAFASREWKEGRVPLSVDTVRLVPWSVADAALDLWWEETSDPGYLDVISKTRAAADALIGGE